MLGGCLPRFVCAWGQFALVSERSGEEATLQSKKKTVLKHRNLNDLQKDFQRDILDHFNCRYDEREIRDDWSIRMKEEAYASNHPCRLEKRFPL
jgi:hypothetical protein